MLYLITVQTIILKYMIFWATQKWQYFHISKFIRFSHFCVAHNIKYLRLIFCTLVGHNVGYIHPFLEFFETHKHDFRRPIITLKHMPPRDNHISFSFKTENPTNLFYFLPYFDLPYDETLSCIFCKNIGFHSYWVDLVCVSLLTE